MKSLLKIAIISCLIASPAVAFAEYSIASLDVNDAKNLIDIGTNSAAEAKTNVCIAVVDPAGLLIAFQRMDKAPLSCIDNAIAKAKAAALYRIKTSINMDRANSNEPSITALPNLIPAGGGVPIVNNDVVVGAVGVSGAIGNIEIKIAEKMSNLYLKPKVQAKNQ